MRWALALVAMVCTLPAQAIDRIQLRAASIAVAGIETRDVVASLQIRTAGSSELDVHAASVQPPAAIAAQTGPLSVRIHCVNPLIREPRFECNALRLQAQSSRWPELRLDGKASFRTDTGAWAASGGGMRIAGAALAFAVSGTAAGMKAQIDLPGLQLAELRPLLGEKLPLPKDLTVSGRGDLHALVEQKPAGLTADIRLALSDSGFQNAAFTWIGEKLALDAHATADLSRTPLTFAVQLNGNKGQALAGPVLLDFDKNPLDLKLNGSYAENVVQISNLQSTQRDLLQLTGDAQLSLTPFAVKKAALNASDIRFPATYASYLQLSLATTPFNQLTTTGTAEARVQVVDNLPVQLDLLVHDLALSDASRALKVDGINSELHWTAGVTGPPRPSWFSWENSQGWGIIGARSKLEFIAQDRDFRLIKPARLPFFDGALLVNTLAAEQIGSESMSGVFDAVIEPISVAPIAKAFGMPEFSGQLSGRIPGLTYKDKLLSLQGNLEANVFDGRVVASNLRVREPLGQWPRLYADIVARNLDLELITSTFEFGSITGRLDVELTGLETFNWTPVAFDLMMATPRGDKSRHRISQRAVQNLSDIGGGGGGVTAALQSGALKFFDEFGYDRIGLSCRLRNDVCQMGGVGAAKTGFYIVKGSGLPRIDIIGNNQRVDWPRLMTQVSDALSNPEGIQLK